MSDYSMVEIIIYCFIDEGEAAYYRDSLLEVEIRNELLLEKVADLQSSLNRLDRKFRLFKAEHVDCKRKPYILYR
jgi:hypothetical protein